MNELFEKIYDEVIAGNEGGYANSKDDLGEETYRGISRRFHPECLVWREIDKRKRMRPDGKIKWNTVFIDLEPIVKDFYKQNFWDRLHLDQIEDIDFCYELFDSAVNCGLRYAGRNLQRTLNLIAQISTEMNELTLDGITGQKTIKSLLKALKLNFKDFILLQMKIFRGNHYGLIAERNHKQAKWLPIWQKRLGLEYKKRQG